MKAIARQNNIHISPRKTGLICDMIRGKSITIAQTILNGTDKKGSAIILKLLNSAIANATNNFSMDPTKLYIYNALADQGSTVKRTLPRAKGSANLIRKRHTHLTIILSDDRNERANDLAALKSTVKVVKKNATNIKIKKEAK
jgi:ribosomal protein L22